MTSQVIATPLPFPVYNSCHMCTQNNFETNIAPKISDIFEAFFAGISYTVSDESIILRFNVKDTPIKIYISWLNRYCVVNVGTSLGPGNYYFRLILQSKSEKNLIDIRHIADKIVNEIPKYLELREKTLALPVYYQ